MTTATDTATTGAATAAAPSATGQEDVVISADARDPASEESAATPAPKPQPCATVDRGQDGQPEPPPLPAQPASSTPFHPLHPDTPTGLVPGPGQAVVILMLTTSGQRCESSFDLKTPMNEIRAELFKHWPNDWTSEQPSQASSLGFLLHGRFMENAKSLGEHGVKEGEKLTVHVVIRKQQGRDGADSVSKTKRRSSKCFCAIL